MKESHRLFFIFLLFIVGHPAFAADAPKMFGLLFRVLSPIPAGQHYLARQVYLFYLALYLQLAQEQPEALPYKPVIVRNTEEALNTVCDGFYFGSRIALSTGEAHRRIPITSPVTHCGTK